MKKLIMCAVLLSSGFIWTARPVDQASTDGSSLGNNGQQRTARPSLRARLDVARSTVAAFAITAFGDSPEGYPLCPIDVNDLGSRRLKNFDCKRSRMCLGGEVDMCELMRMLSDLTVDSDAVRAMSAATSDSWITYYLLRPCLGFSQEKDPRVWIRGIPVPFDPEATILVNDNWCCGLRQGKHSLEAVVALWGTPGIADSLVNGTLNQGPSGDR